jgi:hypothetical protein
VSSIGVLPRLLLIWRECPAKGRKISAAFCATMEEVTGEETALGYGDGGAGEFAAAVVL